MLYHMKGSYILFIHLPTGKEIRIGKKGKIYFPADWYVYIGSALNSLTGRINRHLKKEKNLHWHIDYLLQHASIETIFFKQSSTHEECTLATQFLKNSEPINGFGCSDCRCQSHLFHGPKQQLHQIIHKMNLKRYHQAKT